MDSIQPFIASTATADVNRHLTWMLSEVAGAGPWTKLYHWYRCVKLKFEFIPCNNTFKEATKTTFRPSLYSSINRASEQFADNVVKQMACQTVRYTLAGKYHARSFSPNTLEQVYNTPATTSYSLNPKWEWISMTRSATPYFGLDITLAGANADTATSYQYRLVTTAVVQFKGRKANIDLGTTTYTDPSGNNEESDDEGGA